MIRPGKWMLACLLGLGAPALMAQAVIANGRYDIHCVANFGLRLAARAVSFRYGLSPYLEYYKPDDNLQVWQITRVPGTASDYKVRCLGLPGPHNFLLGSQAPGYEVKYGAILTVGADDDNWATWSIVQYLDSNRWVIRPKGNTDLNLNASGDGPYEQGNPVNLWRWETGAHNEVWMISPR